jgi:hypothetical protein
LAKEAQLPARFLGPNKVPIGRYELSINLIDMLKELKPLKIRFESSTMALITWRLSEWQLGLLCLRLKLKFEIDINYTNMYMEL